MNNDLPTTIQLEMIDSICEMFQIVDPSKPDFKKPEVKTFREAANWIAKYQEEYLHYLKLYMIFKEHFKYHGWFSKKNIKKM